MQRITPMVDDSGAVYDVGDADRPRFDELMKGRAQQRHTFRGKDGQTYDVPEADRERFQSLVPDAEEIHRFQMDDGGTMEVRDSDLVMERWRLPSGMEVGIPGSGREKLKKGFPDAQLVSSSRYEDSTDVGDDQHMSRQEWNEHLTNSFYKKDGQGEAQGEKILPPATRRVRAPGSQEYKYPQDPSVEALEKQKRDVAMWREAGGEDVFSGVFRGMFTNEGLREIAEEYPSARPLAYVNDLANSLVGGLLEGNTKISEATGRLIGDNAVGRSIVSGAKADQEWIHRNLPTDTLDTSGGGVVNTVLQTGKGVAHMTGEFAPAAISGVGAVYAPAVVSAGSVNRYAEVHDAAVQNGMSEAQATGLATGAASVDALQNILLMRGFKGIWSGTTKRAADEAKRGFVRRALGFAADTAKTGATMSVGGMAKDVLDQNVGIDEKGNVGKIAPYDLKRTANVGVRDFVEGGLFHAVNAGVHGLPKAIRWSEIRAENKSREIAFVTDQQRAVLDSPEGRALVLANNPDAALALLEARREGKDVSRKMLKDLGIIDAVAPSKADRNALGDAIVEDYKAYKELMRRTPDEQQSAALDAEIKGLGVDETSAGVIREAVLGKLKDAKELDDPKHRADLVYEATQNAFGDLNREARRENNERIRAEKRQRKADAAADRERAEREAREAAEEQERAIAEKTAEDNKPTISVTGQEAESAPANRLTEYPEYAEWLRKNGRSDTDKNWNKFVAQNEMDPALKVVRDKKGKPVEPEPPAQVKSEVEGEAKPVADEVKPPALETKDAENPAKTEPKPAPEAPAAVETSAEPPKTEPSGGRPLDEIMADMERATDEFHKASVGNDVQLFEQKKAELQKISAEYRKALAAKKKADAQEPAKTAPASAQGAKGTITPPKVTEPAQGAESTAGGVVEPKPDGKGRVVKPEPKSTAPVVSETGNTAEVVPPDSVEAKISAMKRGSPEQLKAQREYLEQEIAKARAAIDGKFDEQKDYRGKHEGWTPKEDAGEIPPTITVKVPGDGEFTVRNTPDGMAFLDKVAAKFKPQKSGKAAEASAPSVPRPPTVAVAKKPKDEAAHKEMEPFVSTDRTRVSLTKPMSDGKYVYATNGKIVVRRPQRKGETVKGVDGAPVESCAGFFDNPEPEHSFKVKVAELYPKLVQADAVTGDGDGKGIIELWHDGNGTLHVRARDGEGNSYATDAGSDYVSRPLTLVNGQYLRDFLKLAAKRGAGEVEIGIVKNGIAKQADAVTLKGGDLDGVLVSITKPEEIFKARAEKDAQIETNRMLEYGERAWVDSLPKKLREERDGLVATASQSGTTIDNELKAKIAKAKDDLAAFDAKHGKSEFVSEFVKNGGKAPAKPKKGKGGADGKLKAVNPDADEAPASGAKKTQGEFDFGESAKKPENPAKKGAATDGGKAAGISFIEPLPEGKPEHKTPEQEIAERLDLARLDPKRRSDPKVLEWAKKNNRTVTNGMVTPDAVRAYDEQMTERAAKQGRRWFPDMKIVAHKYGETIKRGQHVIEARKSPREDPIVSNIRERLKFGENYDPNNSHHIAYSSSRDEIALFHDKGNGEYDIIERVPATEENHARLKSRIESYRAEESAASLDAGIQELESARRAGNVDRGDSVKDGRTGGRHGDLASQKQGDGSRETSRKGEGDSGGVGVSYLRDRAGRVLGWFDPQSKEVHLLPGADPRTVAHEIMWHGTRDYISGLAAKGDARAQSFLDMMHDVEQNAPQAIKDVVNRLYARGGAAVSRDTLLNEYGAWFTMDKGGAALEKAMQTAEGRNWFAKGFHAVKEMYKDYLTRHGKNRVDISAVDGMSRDQFVDWIADQFAGGKALGTIKGEPQKVLSTKETRMQAYRRKAYDNNAPLRDLERDVEKKTGRKISTDDSVEAANALKHGLKEAANIEIQGKMSDFRKALGESGIHYEDLEYYAALKAAAGRDAKIDARNLAKIEADMRAQGASQADIDAAKANYRSVNGSHIDPREARRMLAEIEGGPDAAKYKAAYDKLRAVIDETLAVQEQSGLVGAADAAKWRAEEPNYVPFKNEYEPETGEWAGRGSSRNFTRPEHHTAKGRQSAAGDIIAHVFMDHQAAKHRAIENAVRQKLAKLVRANPELGTVERLGKDAVRNIEKDDPNVVVFKEGGNAYAIRLEGTRGAAIANAFTERNLLKMGWADKGFSVFGKKVSFRSFSHWSAGMATRYSPTFAVRNTLKDNIELANIVYSERGFLAGSKWMGQYVVNRARMSKTLMKYVTTGKIDAATPEGALLDRYIKAGGLIAGGTRAEAFEGIKQKLSPEAIEKEMKRGSSKTRAAAAHVLKSVAYLNEYAEMATRLGVFATEVKGGKSDADAALFSRRATVDFNRHGDYTPAFNMLRLFSNSTLGATARAATALCKSKFGKRAALLMFANGLARAFIDHYLNEDEDKAREARGDATGKDVSEYDRRTSLFYFRSGDKLYKVAQHESPFSLITYAGDCVGRWLCGDLGGAEVAKNIGVTTAELAWNFTPMGQINVTSREGGGVNDFKAALVSGVCPSILQPIAELGANIDYKGDPVFRQMFDNYAPQSHNGKAHTPDWAKSSAEWANEATGGNAGRRGWLDIAPEAVQKLVEGYGKNALRDVSTALSVGEAIVKGDMSGLDPRNTPVKRDFVRPLDGNDGRYFQAVDRHKADRKDFDTGRSTRSKEENESYLAAHPSAYNQVHQSLGKIEDAVNRLRKMENGYAVPKSGAAVPHQWTDEELERFRSERRRLQAQYLSIMQKMDERAKSTSPQP